MLVVYHIYGNTVHSFLRPVIGQFCDVMLYRIWRMLLIHLSSLYTQKRFCNITVLLVVV